MKKANFIMVMIGISFVIFQLIFLPFEWVFEMRALFGPLAWVVAGPFMVGVGLIAMGLFENLEKVEDEQDD